MFDQFPHARFEMLLTTLMMLLWMWPAQKASTEQIGPAAPAIEGMPAEWRDAEQGRDAGRGRDADHGRNAIHARDANHGRNANYGRDAGYARHGDHLLNSLFGTDARDSDDEEWIQHFSTEVEWSRAATDARDPDDEEWIPLFNGRDLEGWAVKIRGHDLDDNFGDTFRVEDGVLKVSYEHYDRFDDRFGHLFTREKHSYYIVAVEYRFVGDQAPGGPDWAIRNSGVMVHSQSAESMWIDQDFPISIEVQLLGGAGSGERTTANLCTPGTHVEMNGELVTDHCINSESKTYHGAEWVRVETLVLGDSLIRHTVEGETVLEYGGPQIGGGVVNDFDPSEKQDGKRLTEGYIALQSESHPIEFRKVELLNLVGCMDPDASNYKSYYVYPDADACRYEPER